MLEPIKIYYRPERTKILNVKHDFNRVSLTIGVDVIKKHLKNELALTIADEIVENMAFEIEGNPLTDECTITGTCPVYILTDEEREMQDEYLNSRLNEELDIWERNKLI